MWSLSPATPSRNVGVDRFQTHCSPTRVAGRRSTSTSRNSADGVTTRTSLGAGLGGSRQSHDEEPDARHEQPDECWEPRGERDERHDHKQDRPQCAEDPEPQRQHPSPQGGNRDRGRDGARPPPTPGTPRPAKGLPTIRSQVPHRPSCSVTATMWKPSSPTSRSHRSQEQESERARAPAVGSDTVEAFRFGSLVTPNPWEGSTRSGSAHHRKSLTPDPTAGTKSRFDHPFDHPDDPSVSVWNHQDRRAI